MTPGWRYIRVDGRMIWAYIGAGKIEAHGAVSPSASEALIDGEVYAIAITHFGASSFDATIEGRLTIEKEPLSLPPAPHID
jgi:hypothetical protein